MFSKNRANLIYKKSILIFIILFLTSSAYSKELKKVSLQLQWKHQFQFAGYYMAKEKGFYKEAGFEVDIKEFEYGMNLKNEIINNRSTFGTGRPTLIINRSSGHKIVLLASIFQSSPNVLLALKDSHIKTIEDFKNKKVMATGCAKNDATIMSMIFSKGLTLNDLNIIEHSFDINDLINNKTDLMSSYISNEPFLLKEKGIEGVIFDPKDYGFDFYNDIIFTTEENLLNNHEDVKSFTLASLKGWRYAFDNIEETAQLILEKYNTQNKSKEALIYEGQELKKLAYYKTDTLGKIDKAKVEKIFDYYRLMGFTKEKIDFNDFVYTFDEPKFHLSKQEQQYLKNKEKINMCIDPNWMPFEKFDDKGDYVGMSADYYELFEKMLSTKFEVVPTKTWSESLKFAQQRKCDILSLVMETPKRKEYMNFTEPYVKVPVILVTKVDTPFISDIKFLKNKKIGIVKNGAFSELLRKKYKNLEITGIESVKAGLEKVESGELYGFADTIISVGKLIQSDFTGLLKVSARFEEQMELSVGVRDDDPVLLNIFQKLIENISDDQKNEILNKWISVKYEKGVDYSLVWKTVFIFTVIILIILYFYFKEQSLKNQLKKQKEILKKQKEILQRQKENFETFFENSPDGISVLKNNKFIYCNQRIVDILKYRSKDEILNIHPSQLSPKFQPDGRSSFEKAEEMMELAVKRKGHQFEWMHTRADGEEFCAEITLTPMVLEGEDVIHVIWRDISDKKKNEEVLLQHSKLVAMGELLGNIAHQWRQPLSVISTGITGLQIKKEMNILRDEEFYDICSHINENTQYLSQTLDDFKDFIKGDIKAVKFDLKNIVEGFIKLIDSSIQKHNIQIITNLEEDIEMIGYPNELKQCFISIFDNTKDAMEENSIDPNERYIFLSQYLKDNKIYIEFKDNAGGIPKEIINKIFEPYFTTKHQSQGTGLGLHMTYNLIVNNMGGTIKAQNITYEYNGKKNKGTLFTIALPFIK